MRSDLFVLFACVYMCPDLFFHSIGATSEFICDEDHVLQGSKSITCQRVAEVFAAWSDHRPACRGESIIVLLTEADLLQCMHMSD